MRTAVNMNETPSSHAFFVGITRLIIGNLLLFISSISAAADYTEFETAVYRLSSDYRAYVYFDGDPKYNRSLTVMVKQADTFKELLNDQPELLGHWNKIIAQIRMVLDDESNIRNVNVQAHWELMLGDLNRALARELKNHHPTVDLNNTRSKSYNRLLMLRMERVLALYMSLTNPVGGLGISAESPNIEDKVKEVSAMLEDSELKNSELKNVIKKWGFVKKTLLKYNTEATPYIVLHSYKKIRLDLKNYIQSFN